MNNTKFGALIHSVTICHNLGHKQPNSAGTKKLLFSPDTDVYHIGLTVFNCAPFVIFDDYVFASKSVA